MEVDEDNSSNTLGMIFWWYVDYFILGITGKWFIAEQQVYCTHFKWMLAPQHPQSISAYLIGEP